MAVVLCCAPLHYDPILPRERLEVQNDERQPRGRTMTRMSRQTLKDLCLLRRVLQLEVVLDGGAAGLWG
jgi:hypothetical protein